MDVTGSVWIHMSSWSWVYLFCTWSLPDQWIYRGSKATEVQPDRSDSTKPLSDDDLLSPTAFGLVLVRPLVPFAIRTIPLSWRIKMIEWLPIKSLKEMRRIVGIMDKTSRTIYSAKLTNLKYPGSGGFTYGEGNLGFRNNGKDIMSILRTSFLVST